MNIGEYLKKKREEVNLSQGEVCKKLGYDCAQSVSNWERELALPPKKKLDALAKIYNVDKKEILQQILNHKIKDLKQNFNSRM